MMTKLFLVDGFAPVLTALCSHAVACPGSPPLPLTWAGLGAGLGISSVPRARSPLVSSRASAASPVRAAEEGPKRSSMGARKKLA